MMCFKLTNKQVFEVGYNNMEKKVVSDLRRSLFIWVLFYGFIVLNLGGQTISFLVHYLSYISCKIDDCSNWEFYKQDLPQNLLFSSIFAPLVCAIGWGIWYLREKRISR